MDIGDQLFTPEEPKLVNKAETLVKTKNPSLEEEVVESNKWCSINFIVWISLDRYTYRAKYDGNFADKDEDKIRTHLSKDFAR